MTDVVIATHADGVLRCYHRGADGALTQTAQIVVGPAGFEPTTLAALVGDLADTFAWAQPAPVARTNGHQPRVEPERREPRAVPAAPKRPHQSQRMTADAVLADIRAHPGTTYPEIAVRLGGDDTLRTVQAVATHVGVLRRKRGLPIVSERDPDLYQNAVRLTYVEPEPEP